MGDASAAGFKGVVNNAETYNAAIARGVEGKLVVLVVWSEANPICLATEPKIEKLAAEFSSAEFYKVLLNAEIQALIKFGIQNTPIFIFAQGEWATTVLGANMRMVEDALKQRT